MLKAGIQGRQEVMVTEDNSASALGSGLLEVFATPAMVSVAPYMNDGESAIYKELNIPHLAATPAGMIVWCESELKEVDGRRLVFHVEAFDESGKIGEGEHERVIVKNEKFMAKALAKKEK